MLGAVACGHPDTARVAADVLRAGGTAFDAGIAAIAAACVAEPVLASLAGGGFALAAPAGATPRLFDFFVATPAERRPLEALDFRALDADFGDETQVFHGGSGTCAVPGVVDGLFALHAALATMPVAELLEPALGLAREGVVLREFDAHMTGIVARIVMATPASAAFFGDPAAPADAPRPAPAGHRFVQPALATLFEALAHEGRDVFYRGEAGRTFVDFLRAGGQLARADLEAYRTLTRTPLALEVGRATLFTNPPPAAGGAMVALILDLVHACRAQLGAHGSPTHLRVLADAMAVAEAARGRCADMQALATASLRAACREALGSPLPSRIGTTHLSVADRDGNLFSATLSNGTGSGQYIDALGLIPNNMLGELDLNPGGFQRWPSSARLVSMMAPTVVRLAGDAGGFALGSGGSNRIRSAVSQVLVNALQYDQPLADAVAAPRVHFEAGHLSIEHGFDEHAVSELPPAVTTHRQWSRRSMFFGGVHAVMCAPRGLAAAADARRAGVALHA